MFVKEIVIENPRNILTESVFRSISDGLIVVGQDGKVVDLNVPAAYSLDITAQETVGEHFLGALNSKDLENQLVDLFAEPDVYSIKRFSIQANDRYFNINFDPIFSEVHERLGVLVVLHDVTDERKLLAAKDELIWAASHEFYTPLAAIRGNLEILSGLDNLTEEMKLAINDAQDGLHRVLRIAEDVLNIASVETGRAEFQHENFDLSKIADLAIAKISPIANEKKIMLVNNSTSALVNADQSKTFEVLLELIENAVKFTDRGSVTIASEAGDMVKLHISDTGIGISEVEKESLFTKFGRLNPTLTSHRGGIGLGLYKVRLYARAMGGTVELSKSAPGSGSTFTLSLPK